MDPDVDEFRLPTPPVGSSPAYNAMAMTFFMLKRSIGHEISRVRQHHRAKNEQEHWETDRVEIVAQLLEAISDTLFSEEHVEEEAIEEQVQVDARVDAPKHEVQRTKTVSEELPVRAPSPRIETPAPVTSPRAHSPVSPPLELPVESQPSALPLSTPVDIVPEPEHPAETAELEYASGLEYPSDLDFMNSDEMAKILAEMELDIDPSQFTSDFDFPDVTISAETQDPLAQPVSVSDPVITNDDQPTQQNGGGYTVVSQPVPKPTDRPTTKAATSNSTTQPKEKVKERPNISDSSRSKSSRQSVATVASVCPAKPRTGQQVFEDLGFLSPEQPFGTNKVWWNILLAIQWAEEQPDNRFSGWADLDTVTDRINDLLAQGWSKQTNQNGLQLLLRHKDGLLKAKKIVQGKAEVELYQTTEDFKNLVVYVRQLEAKARKSYSKVAEIAALINFQQWWTYDDRGERGAVEGTKLETRRKMGPVIRSFWKGKVVRERVERLATDRSGDHFRFLLEFLRAVIDVQERSTGDKHGWYHIHKPGYAHISLVADRFTAGLSKEQDRTLKFSRVRDIAADAVKYELVTVLPPRKAKDPEFYQTTEDLMDLLVFVAGQESFKKMVEAAREDGRFKQFLMAMERESE